MQSRRVPLILFACAAIVAAQTGYVAYQHQDTLRADINGRIQGVQETVAAAQERAHRRTSALAEGAGEKFASTQNAIKEFFTLSWIELPEIPDIEPEINKLAYRIKQEAPKETVDTTPLYLQDFSQVQPAAGPEPLSAPASENIEVEAVLVPQRVTVISSSRDGRIKDIHVDNGDKFRKGDLLIEYDCDDLTAETDIVAAEKTLAAKKTEGTEKLFKLDLISDLEKIDSETKAQQIEARIRLYQARTQQCNIYASFDGRVTNRLANPNEYTRTDRVLMEIASSEPLRAEFLLPSKWLRWVNVGAPIDIMLNETEKAYTARVTRIYGEVDPVSQSIQVVATMDPYADPLLPGMSGQATLNTQRIRDAGVNGYLDTTTTP